MRFELTINEDMVVLVDVTSYDPGERAFTTGLPENCSPGYDEEIEYDLLTLDGDPISEEMENMLDKKDWDMITSEAIRNVKEEANEF